jgi:hypothetical protein
MRIVTGVPPGTVTRVAANAERVVDNDNTAANAATEKRI